ncbi:MULTISPECIES: hypothetical protein [Acinetobacter]|jgi:hypothetical protein|uniref:hypothetical protein n=1 Tax=Acinetobacter TaxID=469 RepID=UPI00070A9920|nr:hypothetical protein [Acinetobacter baumannii]EIB6848658.1 hypothetical protein [Acinetobacter baumannii]KRJ25932.1 hypothetical protein APC81_11630 [Acinetobacter baumannii]MCT9178580.1 hypothetical protein [Acinetobacter baumannii]MCY0274260.1 hypothetical protein [Acinetobacter baumannii]MDO7461882.1 hypothetical protein [Acinetobacter baumannii]
MLLKGNNAEKIATTLIFFIILLVTYILVNLAFRSITHTTLENMVKDGMSFSATAIAPIIAILLFSDWRVQHLAIKMETAAEKIVKNLLDINFEIDILDAEVRKDIKNINVEDTQKIIFDLRKRLIEQNTQLGITFDGEPKTNDFINQINDLMYEMLNYLNLMNIAIIAHEKLKNNTTIFESDEVKTFYADKENLYFKKSFERFTGFVETLSTINNSLREFKIK